MRKTRISLILLAIIAFSAIPFGLFIVTVTGSNPTIEYEPIRTYGEFKGNEVKNYEFLHNVPSEGLKTSNTYGDDYKIMYWYDDLSGIWLNWFYRAYNGTYCEVWVSTWLDYDAVPDDPRNPITVTPEQIEYLAYEFDNTIYPIDTGYFGWEDYHDGWNSSLANYLEDEAGYIPEGAAEEYFYDPDGKTMIMISNIGDESFYDPTYPNYIAGFYWGAYEQDFGRNIINIDAYDYVHRLGDGENPLCESWWTEDDPKNRPNLIESLIAHEYQHLIHDDWFWLDETWMNEASSLFAEPLCGYELDLGQVDWFLATPDNSLTYWGEQGGENILADYGSSFLWALYLTDHYGLDFISRYVQANWEWDDELGWLYVDVPIEPKERISYLLNEMGAGVDFYDVYHDWRIANLIHCDYRGHDRYNYDLDELREATGNDNQFLEWEDTEHPNYLPPLEVLHFEGMTHEWISGEEYFGETLSLEDPPDDEDGYETGYSKLAPFATDYIQFDDLKRFSLVQFLGDEDAIYGWTYDNDLGAWWSGTTDELNALITTEEFIAGADDVLTIDTWYDIEPEWDFGFIQISTDGGETWDSMEDNEGYTTYDIDSGHYPGFDLMLPGLSNRNQDLVSLTFNIYEYVDEGESYMIGFRHATDWAYHYGGWYLDEVLINDNPVELIPDYPEAEFMVTVVQKWETRNRVHYSIYDMFMWGNSNYGLDLSYITPKKEYILIVSTIMEDGYTDYKFSASSWRCLRFNRGWKK